MQDKFTVRCHHKWREGGDSVLANYLSSTSERLSGVQGNSIFAAAAARRSGLTATVAAVDVCTLWHQQAIRVKEPVEQRGSPALGSRVTPAANETLADLGLCGCVD